MTDTETTMGTAREDRVELPSVSVIVPIYNTEEHLSECLDSLLAQTLDSIEIVAVNDGSTDCSGEILREYEKSNRDRIRAFHKPNGGLSEARNFGIERARGEFIGFVDSDDWVDADMFGSMYQQAVETDSDIVVCGARMHYYRDGVELLENSRDINLRGPVFKFGKSVREEPSILWASQSFAVNKLFRRHLFRDHGFRFPPGQWFEDSAVIYNIMFAAEKVSCVQDHFYHYRYNRAGAITATLSPKIFDVFDSCDAILDFYRGQEVDFPKTEPVLEKLVRTHIFARFQLFFANTDRGYEQRTLSWSERWLAWSFARRAFKYLDTEFPGWPSRYKYRRSQNGAPVWWRARKSRALTFILLFMPDFTLQLLRRAIRISRVANAKARRTVRRVTSRNNRSLLAQKAEAKKKAEKQRALQRDGFAVLDQVSAALSKSGVTFFVDFGTLLGFVRDGGFMKHDLDIDFGVFADEESRLDVFAALDAAGFVHYRTYLFEENVVQYSFFSLNRFGRKSIKFDINFYEDEGDKSCCWLFHYLPDSGLPLRARFATKMTYSQIEGIELLNVQGHSVPVPKSYERLLVEKYGPSWTTPDPSWVYWDSPAATPLQTLGRYITQYQLPEEKLPGLQSAQLEVLEALEHVCQEHGLRYYLAEGTLLGAVRHQGYIPWDDDIDIAMPRKDYERLLNLPADSWPYGFSLWNHLSDPDYHLPFTKVVGRAHKQYRNTFPAGLDYEFSGPRVDVFPLDSSLEVDGPEKRAIARQIRIFRNSMLVKAGYPGKKVTADMPRNLRLIPMIVFQKWIIALSTIWNDTPDAGFVVNWSSSYSHLKETWPREWYESEVMMMFEGKLRPCPRGYHEILTSIYGDYMDLPPESKRQPKSHFVIYDKWAK